MQFLVRSRMVESLKLSVFSCPSRANVPGWPCSVSLHLLCGRWLHRGPDIRGWGQGRAENPRHVRGKIQSEKLNYCWHLSWVFLKSIATLLVLVCLYHHCLFPNRSDPRHAFRWLQQRAECLQNIAACFIVCSIHNTCCSAAVFCCSPSPWTSDINMNRQNYQLHCSGKIDKKKYLFYGH